MLGVDWAFSGKLTVVLVQFYYQQTAMQNVKNYMKYVDDIIVNYFVITCVQIFVVVTVNNVKIVLQTTRYATNTRF